MILLDANVLLYAYNADAPEHAQARRWLEDLLAGPERVGIAWLTVWAFVRISTNARIMPVPLHLRDAFGIIRELLQVPRVAIVHPGARHVEHLERVATEGQATGPRFTDAALAALAIEHGATLASTDRDFTRFPGLRWVNPVSPPP